DLHSESRQPPGQRGADAGSRTDDQRVAIGKVRHENSLAEEGGAGRSRVRYYTASTGFLGEHQQTVVGRQIVIRVQCQAVLQGQRGDFLDVAQAGQRVAFLKHTVEFLVAPGGMAPLVAERAV